MSKVEVKDFRKTEDKEQQIDEIYQAMIAITTSLANMPPDATLDKKIALPYPKDKERKYPLGYEICDGENGTDDLRTSFTDSIIYIQRIR